MQMSHYWDQIATTTGGKKGYCFYMASQRSNRTQVLLTDAVNDQVEKLAKQTKRSKSAMCAELIEFALIHHSKDFSNQDTPLDEPTLRRLSRLVELLDSLD